MDRKPLTLTQGMRQGGMLPSLLVITHIPVQRCRAAVTQLPHPRDSCNSAWGEPCSLFTLFLSSVVSSVTTVCFGSFAKFSELVKECHFSFSFNFRYLLCL